MQKTVLIKRHSGGFSLRQTCTNKWPPTLFLSSKNFLVLLLFNSLTLLNNKNSRHWFNKVVGQSANPIAVDGCSCVHLSLSALFLMLLSWLMALLFSMDILAWLARISLLCLELWDKTEKQLFSWDAAFLGPALAEEQGRLTALG